MDAITEDTRLPADIGGQQIVRDALALRPAIRSYHSQIEEEQRFPADLVAQMTEAGLYRMTIPRSLGGEQVDPLTYTHVVETMSASAGSVGWNVANNSIVQLVVLGLPDDGINEVFAKGPTVMAGTAVQGGGKAVPVPGGYRVTGRWPFGSGSQEASWMLGSFQIMDGDTPRKTPDGNWSYWRGVFPKHETETVEGSWDVSGLRGTGSFDWTVKDVFIPEHRVMIHAGAPLDNQWAKWPGLTYQLPAQAWVSPHHSSVITGIAMAGVQALLDLAMDKSPRGRTGMLKENPQVQDAVGRADMILSAGRTFRSTMLRELWDTVAAGQETTLEQRSRCRLAAVHAADCAREAMDLVYRHGGSTSFRRDSRLAECWRDLHVVGQTVTIAPEWYPIGGRVLLGMDPGSRMR